MLRPTWNCGLGGESTAPVEPLAVARLKLPPTTHEPQTTERLSAASTLATFGPILRVVPRRQKVLQPGTGQRAGFVPLNEILVGLDIRHCRPETHGRALGHDTAPGRRETGKEGELRAISRLLALFVGPVLAQSCKLVPTGGVARPRGAVWGSVPGRPSQNVPTRYGGRTPPGTAVCGTASGTLDDVTAGGLSATAGAAPGGARSSRSLAGKSRLNPAAEGQANGQMHCKKALHENHLHGAEEVSQRIVKGRPDTFGECETV